MKHTDEGQELLKKELKKKFRGQTRIKSRYAPKYPDSVERDYIRMMNQICAEAIKAPMEAYYPELIQILREAEKKAAAGGVEPLRLDEKGKRAKENEKERASRRRQALAVMAARLEALFKRIQASIMNGMGLARIRDWLNIIAGANRKLTIREWKKAIGKTLGINILEDYYDGLFYAEMLEKWVSDNVDLIVTIPSQHLDRMKKIVLDSYLSGKPTSEIIKEIQKSYGITKSRARLIARDQMGKLNCQITRHQQESCGVSSYIWKTCQDSRVRDGHRNLNNKTFEWAHPPVVDKKGRRCHPGEDYQCRCIALPVFDLEKLNLPVDGRRG